MTLADPQSRCHNGGATAHGRGVSTSSGRSDPDAELGLMTSAGEGEESAVVRDSLGEAARG